MFKALFISFTALSALLFVGCQGLPKNPPPVVDSVELERYMGVWYEIARMPVSFQNAEDLAMTEYRLLEDGTVTLVNTAIRPDGRTESVTGTAVPVPGSDNAKLKVTIDNFFAKLFGSPPDHGNYWILRLAEDYSVVLVGSPDRDTLWLLARQPEINPKSLESYLRAAKEKGYPTDDMILNNGEFPMIGNSLKP